MKKFILIITLVAAVLLFMYSYQVKNQKAENKNVKIGAVLTLTGNMSEYGKAVKDGITLAIEENEENKTFFNYEIVFEDDQMDAKKSATAIHKLIYMDKIDAALSITSGTGNVIAPIAAKNNIVHFSYADDNTIATNQKYSFNRNIRYEDLTSKIIDLFNQQNVKSIYFVNFIHSSSKRLMKAIEPQVNKSFDVMGNEWVNASDREYRNLAENIKRKNPDAVYLYVLEPALSILGKELKNVGYEGKILTSYLFSYAKNKELFEGCYFVNTKKPNKEFKDKFKKRFGYEPNLGSGEVYDNTNLIIKTFEKNRSKNPDRFLKEIKSVIKNYKGAIDKIEITEGKVIYNDLVFNKVENGKIVEVNE